MEIHEAALIFPIDEEHIAELGRDITKNGLMVPIETLDGKVIDGRRRLRACELADVQPKFIEVNTDDPVAYVLSLNLHRRHLTPSQLAMVGARARGMYDKQAKERQKDHGKTAPGKKSLPVNFPEVIRGDARDAVGKAVGVSGRSIDYATKVLENAVPEVVKAVDEGRMAISTAAILSTEPEDVQRREATAPKRNREYVSQSEQSSRKANRKTSNDDTEATNGSVKGKGVILANEAINCLIRIPKNDALRKRGFQIVTDWIRKNS